MLRFAGFAVGLLGLLLAVPLRLKPMLQESIIQLRSDTRVVEVDVTVRDADSKPVKGLKQEDFSILDDGKPRSFSIFRTFGEDLPGSNQEPRPATPAPPLNLPPNTYTNLGPPHLPEGHSTVILLDGVNSWFDNYRPMQLGVMGMLDKIPADERIALYIIAKQHGLVQLQDYTTDRAAIRKAIADYTPPAMRPAPPGLPESPLDGLIEPAARRAPPPPPPSDSSGGDSAAASLAARKATMASAINKSDDLLRAGESVRLTLKTLVDQLGKQPGRKSVFWVTEGLPPVVLRGDGINNTTDMAWKNTISDLNQANIAVNTIDNNGVGGPPRLWGRGTILSEKQIAEETGGRSFYLRNDIDNVLAEGISDSRSGYVLGFYLTQTDGTYHSLKVKVKRPNVSLSYRQGYFSRDQATTVTGKPELSALLMSPTDSTDLGMTATLEPIPGSPNGKLIVHLRLAPDALTLKKNGDGWSGELNELLIERNAEGREVGRLSAKGAFAVKPDQRESFDQTGAKMDQTIPFVAEAVKLSIVVSDSASGRVGSLSIPLDQLKSK